MSTATAALGAIRRAIRAGAWQADPHLLKRLTQRRLLLSDVLEALRRAERATPHDMRPLNPGGESWRVYGRDSDDRLLGVGVEILRAASGGFVVIITAFVEENDS